MMWDELLDYCLAKPGAWQDEPWGDGIVAKVGPKIFAFLRAVGPGGQALGVGLKCGATREAADEWLLRYPADASVMAYIGRSGWNNLTIGAAIPDDEILEAIDASYQMVLSKLPKKDRPVPLGDEPPQVQIFPLFPSKPRSMIAKTFHQTKSFPPPERKTLRERKSLRDHDLGRYPAIHIFSDISGSGGRRRVPTPRQ